MGNSINISGYLGRKTRYIEPPTASCDADAQAFITAAGITDSTQIAALCQLVIDLKSSGVWSSLEAVYPFVGGTATTHRYNLKNPSLHTITWFGGVTHNSNGVIFNQINSYGDTGYKESVFETNGSTHRSVYDRSTNIDFGIQIGAQDFNANKRNSIYTNYSNQYYSDCYDATVNLGRLTGANLGSNAFWTSSRTSLGAGDYSIYRNNVVLNTSTGATIGSQPVATNVFIGGLNDTGVLSQPSGHNLAFASMGGSLSSGLISAYYTAVQTFQTTLGRQV
jgi:hypothetical protein